MAVVVTWLKVSFVGCLRL